MATVLQNRIPVHCDKPMIADYVDGQRQNYRCANCCGHREYTGMIGVLKVYKSVFSSERHCKKCGGALPVKALAQTKYHKHCYKAVRRDLDKVRRLEHPRSRSHRPPVTPAMRAETERIMARPRSRPPTAAMVRAKEESLAGIRRGA